MREAADYPIHSFAHKPRYQERNDQKYKGYKKIGQHQHQVVSPSLQLAEQQFQRLVNIAHIQLLGLYFTIYCQAHTLVPWVQLRHISISDLERSSDARKWL